MLHPGAVAVGGELLLHSVEQGRRDDRLMLSRMARALVVQLAEVDPVAQEIREGTIGQRHAPDSPARAERAHPCDDAALPQLALKSGQGVKGEIALEDQPDGRSLVLSDDELALAHLVAERDDAPDPDALA